MEVRDGFAAVGTVVDDEAVAVGKTGLLGDFRRLQQQMAEHRVVGGRGIGDAGDGLARHDENVRGCLWVEVAEGEDVLVFVNQVRRNLLRGDAFKEGFVPMLVSIGGGSGRLSS